MRKTHTEPREVAHKLPDAFRVFQVEDRGRDYVATSTHPGIVLESDDMRPGLCTYSVSDPGVKAREPHQSIPHAHLTLHPPEQHLA